MRRSAPALVALAAGLGCNPPADVEPLACRNPEAGRASLGAGDLEIGFVPLAEGDAVALEFGPQGMHMVVLSVRVEDLETASVAGLGNEVSLGLYEDGALVGGTVGDLTPVEAADGAAEFLGMRAIITAAEVEDVGDRMAWVEATVVDGCGRELVAGLDLWLSL